MRARNATVDDYELFLRFFAALELPDAPPPFDWWRANQVHASFLEEGEDAVAYGHAYMLGDLGYVMNLAVDPRARRRGYGEKMMLVLAERLRERGATRWYLFVKDDNLPAIALYEKLGMRSVDRAVSLQVSRSALEELPEAEAIVEPFPSEDDERIERAFGLPRGRLARDRSNEGWLVRRARRGDELVGMIVFEPRTATAYRVRASDAAVLRALTLPFEHDSLRLNLDAMPPIVEQLLALGAETKLSLLRMEGPLTA